jgi:hypothetical protein
VRVVQITNPHTTRAMSTHDTWSDGQRHRWTLVSRGALAAGLALLVLGLFATAPAAASSTDGAALSPDDPVITPEGTCADPAPLEPDYGTDDPGVGPDRDWVCSPELEEHPNVVRPHHYSGQDIMQESCQPIAKRAAGEPSGQSRFLGYAQHRTCEDAQNSPADRSSPYP